MFHKKDIEKDRIYQRTIDYILKAQGDLFQAGSTLTGYVPHLLIEKIFSKIEYNKEKPICIYSDYGEWVDFLIEKYGYDVNFKLVPSSLFGYEMSIRSLERYTENPADFVIFNREKYESMTMIDKYFDDIMKETGMIYQVMTGNPPYGTDTKGSSRFLHYKILENSLKFCSDKLCFIMPSKPITQQLDDPWYSLFKNAVCVDVDVVDKNVFSGTTQDNTAIYYIDVNADKSEYCKKLDVNERMYDSIDMEGKLFVDGMKKFFSDGKEHLVSWRYKLDIVNVLENQMRVLKSKMTDGCYYLNVNRANGAMGAHWISDVLEKVDVLTKEEELDFCENVHKKFKSIIECPNKEYGLNLKNLMLNGLVLRYALWLTQRNQTMGDDCYVYVPDIDYTNIHNDEELLSNCGFSSDDISKIINYLKTFDFTRNRNEEVRSYNDSSSGPDSSKPIVDDEDEETQEELRRQNILDRNNEEDED